MENSKRYEVIIKKDKVYGLDRSPYVWGRVMGILEGSGAVVLHQTIQCMVKHPYRVLIVAGESEYERIFKAIERCRWNFVEIRDFNVERDLSL